MFRQWLEETHWLHQIVKACTDADQSYFILAATITIITTSSLINGLNKKGIDDFILILFLNTVWLLFLFSIFNPSLWLQMTYFSAITITLPTMFLIIWKLRWDKYCVKIILSIWGSLFVGVHALVLVSRGVFIEEYVYFSMILSIPFVWHIMCFPSEEFIKFLDIGRKKVSLDLWLSVVIYFVFTILSLILLISRAVILDRIMALESVPRQIKNTYSWFINAHPLICITCLPLIFLFSSAMNYAFIQIYPNYNDGPYHILLIPLLKRLNTIKAPWYLILPSTLLYFGQKFLSFRNASYWISCFWVLISFIFTVSLLQISYTSNLKIIYQEWIVELKTLQKEVRSFLSYFLILFLFIDPWFFPHLISSYDHAAVHIAMSFI